MGSNHRLSVQSRASLPLDHSRRLRCSITAGLVERTRTADPPVPNRVLCQAELQPGEGGRRTGQCASRGSNPRRHGLRVHRSTTELEAPGAGGEGRTLTGVSPPGSEPGASSIPPRPRGGPSRARTGTRLAANEGHCHSCSGPTVPVGRIERPQAQMPRGLRPRSSSQQRSPGRDRSV